MEEQLSEIEKNADQHASLTINPEFYSKIVLQLANDTKKAEETEKNIKLIARHVMLLDLYYETNNLEYKDLAEKAKIALLKNIPNNYKGDFEKLYKKLSTFWKYEKSLLGKKKFSKKERMEYIRKKSSDVFMYIFIAEFSVHIPKNVIDALYALQQLNDICDDIMDTKEDRENGSPNLIFLFSWDYKDIKSLSGMENIEMYSLVEGLTSVIRKNTMIEFPFIFEKGMEYQQKIVNML